MDSLKQFQVIHSKLNSTQTNHITFLVESLFENDFPCTMETTSSPLEELISELQNDLCLRNYLDSRDEAIKDLATKLLSSTKESYEENCKNTAQFILKTEETCAAEMGLDAYLKAQKHNLDIIMSYLLKELCHQRAYDDGSGFRTNPVTHTILQELIASQSPTMKKPYFAYLERKIRALVVRNRNISRPTAAASAAAAPASD